MRSARALALLLALASAGHGANPPVLIRSESKDWILQAWVYTSQAVPRQWHFFPDPNRPIPKHGEPYSFDIAGANVYFPLPRRTAAHQSFPDELFSSLNWKRESIPTVRIEGNQLAKPPVPDTWFEEDIQPDFLEPIHPDEPVGRWTIGPSRGNHIRLEIEVPMRCWKVDIDEERARKIEWPKGPLPEHMAAYLADEPMLEKDDAKVRALVTLALGRGGKKPPPVVAAKQLAAVALEHYQCSGSPQAPVDLPPGLTCDADLKPERDIGGFNCEGAAFAAREGRGSPWSLPCLVAAMWRAACIPARVVFGLDAAETARARQPVFHAWAEFCLIDESDATVEWIPVDIIRQREFGSRPPPLKQHWEFFGKQEHLNDLLPIAIDRLTTPSSIDVVPLRTQALWGWKFEPIEPKSKFWPDRLNANFWWLNFGAYESSKRPGQESPIPSRHH